MKDWKRFPISKASIVTELHRVLTSKSEDYVNLLEIDQMLLIDDIFAIAEQDGISPRLAQVELMKRIGGRSNLGAYVSTLIAGSFKRGTRN